MRISSNGEQRVDLSVFIRGQRVHEEQVSTRTTVRHPAQIANQVAQDYKKTFMQREEVKQAAILPEEVVVHAQLVYR